jgi:predicted esterase
MKRGLHIILAALVLLGGSCSGRAGSGSTRQGGLEPGTVIPDVKCASDPSCSYSVYLPASYAGDQKLPVYIAFDPMGRGTFPVTRYKELAEKYQFILIGSNDSRNGQSMNDIGRIAEALMNEAKGRFRADSTRIFLTGFSGGARVASIIGMFGDKVQGVVGCGAGFPETDQEHLHSFDYFAIAGEADPNLSEVITQDQALTRAGWKHLLLVIPGGHTWPPAPEMDKAVRWMRGELPPLPIPAVPLATYYKIDQETSIQVELINHFILGDTLWMKKQVRKLRSQAEQPKDVTDSLMARRLIAFLGMVSWSKSTGQLNQKLLDQAYRSLVIYRMVEPDNPAVDSLFRIYYQARNR